MNYNKRENDDLKIKAHLDASLNEQGISVSEELINRTLAAIKENAARMDDKDKSSVKSTRVSWSKYNRYIRGFAKVAAVVLIIAAGYAFIRNWSGSGKKADMGKMEMNTASSEGRAELYDYTDSTNDAAGQSSESFALDEEAKSSEVSISMENENMLKSPITLQSRLEYELSINDKVLAEPEKIQSIAITEADADPVTLTDRNEISDFCAVMAKYQFTGSSLYDDAENRYIISVSKEDEGVYTISVGSRVTVELGTDENLKQEVYDVEDINLLLDDIGEFYNRYK